MLYHTSVLGSRGGVPLEPKQSVKGKICPLLMYTARGASNILRGLFFAHV